MAEALEGITAEATAAASKAVGQALAKLFGEPFLEPILETAGTVARYHLMHLAGVIKPLTIGPFMFIEAAQPDKSFGLTPDGLYTALRDLLEASITMSMVNPEWADEYILEMVSEATSNALQYNITAVIQSVLNAWRGAYPPEPQDLQTVGQNLDSFDDNMALLLALTAGANIPTTAYHLVVGVENAMAQSYTTLQAKLASILEQIEQAAMMFHRHAFTLAERLLIEAVEAAFAAKEAVAATLRYLYERAAARLQEYLAELMTIKAYKDAQLFEPQDPQKNEAAAALAAMPIYLEAKAVMNGVQLIEQVLMEELQAEPQIDYATAIDLAKQLLTEYTSVLAQAAAEAVAPINADYAAAATRLALILSTMSCYRTLYDSGYDCTPPVEVSYTEARVTEAARQLPIVVSSQGSITGDVKAMLIGESTQTLG